MTLANGVSEIDTVVLRLPDYGREIRNWSTYRFNSAFLSPTSEWSFSVSDEDQTLAHELLVPGAKVELALNDRLQCTGYIDKQTVETSPSGGTVITVQGRDILGKVVDSCVDPAFKFVAGSTLLDVLLAVLKPFGIDTVSNSDALNIGVITGLPKGSASSSKTKVKVQVPKRVTQKDGTVKLEYETVDGFVTNDRSRPDLKKVTVDQMKPRMGEGASAYIDRFLRRFGFAKRAEADGSGVIVDRPDFTTAPRQRIIHRRSDPSQNNVEYGRIERDLTSQPSVIVAFGFGGGKDLNKSKLKVIAINELTGLDNNGSPLPEIENIKARYKGAKVLPIRKELVPLKRPLGDQKITRPMFIKDDESRTIEQLEAFVRRTLAEFQQKSLRLNYELTGHTYEGFPWSINTLVDVDDEVLGIQGPMWVLDKTFTKSSGGGTTSSLTLIQPFTLQIA